MVTAPPEDVDVAQQVRRSVQEVPTKASPPGQGGHSSFLGQAGGGEANSHLILQLSHIADEVTPWGINWRYRDRMLRASLHMEPFLGSTVANLLARYSSLRWVLDGPEQTVDAMQEVLVRGSDFGNGWNSLMRKLGNDLLSTDNGAFMECLRDGTDATDPVIGLAHLDSNRCVRTGVPSTPVIYLDDNDKEHLMAEHQVKMLVDNPSPITTMRGMQICAVSRALKLAQLQRDITNFRREKIGGRSPNAIHLIAGITADDLEAVRQRVRAEQDQMARQTFSDPLIFTAFDTEAGVSTATINLADLPEGFDLDTEYTWYITILALAFGVDYQDIAPLQQGNLGNAEQSKTLDRKSRGKGPALWQSLIRHVMNFEGILPEGVSFDYDEEDPEEDMVQAELAAKWIDTLAKAKSAGITNADQAQQILLDKGIIDQDQADLFEEEEPEPAPVVAGPPRSTGSGSSATGGTQPGDLQRGQRARTLAEPDAEERAAEADDLGLVILKRLDKQADAVLDKIEESLGA